MTVILLIIGVVAVVAVMAFSLTRLRHSSQNEGRTEGPVDSRSDRFYRRADRPAGPDAEDAVTSGQPNPPNRS
ncbi:hypothetical protein BH23ACT2_BH23ACT2_15100 [soil metagenome]